jgi:hypothetical protein
MSAVVKKALTHLALHPETALLTFCGDTGLLPPVYSLLQTVLAARISEHGGWPMAPGGAAILIRG